MSTLWYFGLAPQKSRYTEQLSQRWMPRAFNDVFWKSPNKWCDVESTTGKDLTEGLNDDVRTGVVLDDYSRVVHCYRQCENFAKLISLGEVKNGDAIFLQDYWTPGIEGILYSLSVRGISVRLYAMCHAQSVDVYDFTNAMEYWIRNAELSIDRYINKNGGAIFVASSVHRQQLRGADFLAPIHVMGLPFDYYDVRPKNKVVLSPRQRPKKVVFASRMHPEKQPEFMLNVAEQVLKDQEAEWVITTSAQDIQTSTESAQYIKERIDAIRERTGNRLEVKTGLSKEEYYQELLTSKVIFNCSLQDFVSWTLLEGVTHGCIPVYPNFRSFPECLPEEFLYQHYDVDGGIRGEEFSSTFEAVCIIHDILNDEFRSIAPYDTVLRCNAGRLFEASIIDWELINQRNVLTEQNVWELPVDVIHFIDTTSRRRW